MPYKSTIRHVAYRIRIGAVSVPYRIGAVSDTSIPLQTEVSVHHSDQSSFSYSRPQLPRLFPVGFSCFAHVIVLHVGVRSLKSSTDQPQKTL
ncbi:Hypothetical predicted protein [Prunus dulcis]|uniref:Uncharacterized protein n=1 Tax=Prunus dulcis TaxID=3755 RepID=A0A5E4GIY7_PRUDU|nr:Hypothetical predicted protein [Prunus dulcis]